MADLSQIQFGPLENFYLDPQNPRLSRAQRVRRLDQEALLRALKDWTLDELAESFVVSGFWPQEPLICVIEKIGTSDGLIVVEGNRRLAALRWMKRAVEGDSKAPSRIQKVVNYESFNPAIFEQVPFIVAKDRATVDSYLGFRHVTGIKEWNPAEKAEFVAKLIEEQGYSYEEVRRKIGSKAPHVRQLYIAFNLLRTIEEMNDEGTFDVSLKAVESKFSVLQVGLSKEGFREYLGIDSNLDPVAARTPITKDRYERLANVARWIFGTDHSAPLITDSRNVGRLSEILRNDAARDYLEKTDEPNFEIAHSLTDESAADLVSALRVARNQIQFVLARIDLHPDNKDVKNAIWPVISGSVELARRLGPETVEKMGAVIKNA